MLNIQVNILHVSSTNVLFSFHQRSFWPTPVPVVQLLVGLLITIVNIFHSAANLYTNENICRWSWLVHIPDIIYSLLPFAFAWLANLKAIDRFYPLLYKLTIFNYHVVGQVDNCFTEKPQFSVLIACNACSLGKYLSYSLNNKFKSESVHLHSKQILACQRYFIV